MNHQSTTLKIRSSELRIHLAALDMALGTLKTQGADTDFLETVVKQLRQFEQNLRNGTSEEPQAN